MTTFGGIQGTGQPTTPLSVGTKEQARLIASARTLVRSRCRANTTLRHSAQRHYRYDRAGQGESETRRGHERVGVTHR